MTLNLIFSESPPDLINHCPAYLLWSPLLRKGHSLLIIAISIAISMVIIIVIIILSLLAANFSSLFRLSLLLVELLNHALQAWQSIRFVPRLYVAGSPYVPCFAIWTSTMPHVANNFARRL
jgi:hypothetical protein